MNQDFCLYGDHILHGMKTRDKRINMWYIGSQFSAPKFKYGDDDRDVGVHWIYFMDRENLLLKGTL